MGNLYTYVLSNEYNILCIEKCGVFIVVSLNTKLFVDYYFNILAAPLLNK